MCNMKTRRFFLPALILVTLAHAALNADDELERRFSAPPVSAQPMTWWHWMNGNITREGITADLESMARVGIVGAQVFNVANKSAVNIPAGPIRFMSPEWLDLLAHADREASRLGMTLGMHNSAGWSGSGGPWVKPEHSMKKVVWREVQVSAPTAGPLHLSAPESTHGFYRDIAVVAFPTPARRPPLLPAPEKVPLHGDAPPREIDLAQVTDDAVVPFASVVLLTDRMSSDGRLDWTPPPGTWTVIRFGYTSNARENRPAAPEATGLESDKFSRAALDHFWAGGIQPILNKVGPREGKGLQIILVDSYEAGRQNWTDLMADEFSARRDYRIEPFLPVLAGWVIGSSEQTRRFQWDFNRTCADLMADNFYTYFAEKCRKAGLEFASEPYGNGGFEPGAVAIASDLILGEFWVNRGIHASPKVVASAAHTFGKTIVGAESFTAQPEQGRWQNHPGTLKGIGDRMWTEGINRFVFHSFPHQPWTDKVPGMTMGMWGTHFGRTNTWWEQGAEWIRYVARSQALLQAGSPVADVLVFPGLGQARWPQVDPALRAAGYDYDLVTTSLLSQLRVENGQMVLPSGTRYRVLEISGAARFTPELAGVVRDLVRAGGTVIAPRPTASPSLTGWPQADREVAAIAEEVWGPATKDAGRRRYGKGDLFWGTSAVEVLREMHVPPDFAPTVADPELCYIHRRQETKDLYFVSNQAGVAKTAEVDFRVTGRQPELWSPLTGARVPAGLWQSNQRSTRVTLSLAAGESVFVVFQNEAAAEAPTVRSLAREGRGEGASAPPAQILVGEGTPRLLAWESGHYVATLSDGSTRVSTVDSLPAPLSPAGPWTVDFMPDRGAPDTIELRRLIDWTAHADAGVRHFSGSATYRTGLDVPADFRRQADRIELDLGVVHVIAEVTLNGQFLGTLWHPPYAVDVSHAVRPGRNELEVRVTNLWPNRIIGDEALPAEVEWKGRALADWPAWMREGQPRPPTGRVTFATWHHWELDDPLLPSGLVGPVRLRGGRLAELAPSNL